MISDAANAALDAGFSDGRFMVEIREWNWDFYLGLSQPRLPMQGTDALPLVGVSGGPVLRVGESSGLVGFRLAGIISEARADYGYVIVRRADYVRADGTIMRAPPR